MVCTAIALVLVATGCGGESWPFREPVATVAQSYRAPVGEQVVFDIASFVNDGPGEVELREIAVPAGSGFELLDTRVVVAPLGAVPGSGGRTPDSISDAPRLSGAVVPPGHVARPLLALEIVDTGDSSSSFDHVIVTTSSGDHRYDVGLEVCYGAIGSSPCRPESIP